MVFIEPSKRMFVSLYSVAKLLLGVRFDRIELIYEPRREKTVFFAYAKTKTQIKLISAFLFAT